MGSMVMDSRQASYTAKIAQVHFPFQVRPATHQEGAMAMAIDNGQVNCSNILAHLLCYTPVQPTTCHVEVMNVVADIRRTDCSLSYLVHLVCL